MSGGTAVIVSSPPPLSPSASASSVDMLGALIPLYKIPPVQGRTPAPVAFPKDEIVQFSRESFARVMVDPNLYSAFVDYVEIEHCGENIQFYQELCKLEDLVACSLMASSIQEAAAYESARSIGSTHALARFLRAAATTSQTNIEESTAITSVLITLPPLPVQALPPPNLRTKYFDIFTTFIAQGSPMEINVTDATRKRIANALVPILSISAVSSKTGSPSPAAPEPGAQFESFPCTVFNAAGDEIVDLLYRDTFKRFVAWRAKNASAAPPPPSESGSSTPSSSRPSHDIKRQNKREKDSKQEDDFEDPMADLSPEMAMMLLAQAAIKAEQAREARMAEKARNQPQSKKKDLPFWRRKKDRSDSAGSSTGSLQVSAGGDKGGKGSSSSSLDPSPPHSRRTSTSSQASNGTHSTGGHQQYQQHDERQSTDGNPAPHFSKPTNARRKNSIFSSARPNINDIQEPLPSSTPQKPEAASKSSKRSPVNALPSLDVSDSSLRRSEDLGKGPEGKESTKAPKSAGWAGFKPKTPTGSGGGWFGRKNSQHDVMTTEVDAPPVPNLPGHLKKERSMESLKNGSGTRERKKSIFSS
ncbi:hypothetical protein HDU97_009137 [Phlyctochytrium planicorne]|nr:hypothetical protein HDU97_009137 [Phlyctochytrium planicorne]